MCIGWTRRQVFPFPARAWYVQSEVPPTLPPLYHVRDAGVHRECLPEWSLAALVLVVCRRRTPAAEDWPGWRGPRADGTVTDTGFPLTWTATENVKWKTELRGTGHSSPIVSKGKVFVAGCIEAEKKRVLYCVDRATGKIEWEKVAVVSDLEKKHGENSWASSTPAADGERVYITLPRQAADARLLLRLRRQLALGEVARRVPLARTASVSPPMLYKDLVIVNGDQDAPNGQAAFIVALDKKTGEEKWRIDRPNKLRSYCPPVVIDAAGKKQLVLTGSKCVASYDPDTGKQHWIIDGPTEQFVSSMVLHDGVLLMTAGYPVHWVMAIDPSGSGNVTKTHVLWSKKNEGGYVPSPVAHDGKLYLVDDKGVASCWDVKTGKQDWKERLSGEGPPRLRRRAPTAASTSRRGRRHHVRPEGRPRSSRCWRRTRSANASSPRRRSRTARSSSAGRSTCGALGRRSE